MNRKCNVCNTQFNPDHSESDYGEEPFYYSAGERIAQGIFLEYGKVDGDMTVAERTGGFGSTGKE